MFLGHDTLYTDEEYIALAVKLAMPTGKKTKTSEEIARIKRHKESRCVKLSNNRGRSNVTRRSKVWFHNKKNGIVICHWCQQELSRKTMTVDHLKELSNGGNHNPKNMVPSCEECNNSRSNNIKRFINRMIEASINLRY